jgi:hypothetical protein
VSLIRTVTLIRLTTRYLQTMMLPSQLLSSPTTSLPLLPRVWQSARRQKMKKAMMQMQTRKMKRAPHVLRLKHRQKLVADVVVVVELAVQAVALDKVADSAVVLHKVAGKPVVVDQAVAGDNHSSPLPQTDSHRRRILYRIRQFFK